MEGPLPGAGRGLTKVCDSVDGVLEVAESVLREVYPTSLLFVAIAQESLAVGELEVASAFDEACLADAESGGCPFVVGVVSTAVVAAALPSGRMDAVEKEDGEVLIL